MSESFNHTNPSVVNDINNYLKTNTEICMDFKMRMNSQASAIDDTQANPNASYNRISAIVKKMEIQWQDLDSYAYLEENY